MIAIIIVWSLYSISSFFLRFQIPQCFVEHVPETFKHTHKHTAHHQKKNFCIHQNVYPVYGSTTNKKNTGPCRSAKKFCSTRNVQWKKNLASLVLEYNELLLPYTHNIHILGPEWVKIVEKKTLLHCSFFPFYIITSNKLYIIIIVCVKCYFYLDLSIEHDFSFKSIGLGPIFWYDYSRYWYIRFIMKN